VFFGKACDGEKICVKFARTYSKEMHLRCAASGHAPALKGFEKIAGGWYMIVMDDVRDSHEVLEKDYADKEVLMEEMKKLLTELHQAGLVHGDIRKANTLVGDDGRDFMLVDFDWAGKIGEVRYPKNVTRSEDLWRPDGARDGMLILADHDMTMLSEMVNGGHN